MSLKTFKMSGRATVSCWTKVEANSEEEAIEIAKRRSLSDFHIDGSSTVEEGWHFDNDGLPYEVQIEK